MARLSADASTRELSVYDLVVGKYGPNLNVSDTDEAYCCGGGINIGHGEFTARGATVPLFVRILTDNLDRPVPDKTDLIDHYDFDIDFDRPEGAAWSRIGPQLLTFVQQFGLRLEPKKELIEMLVVDSAGQASQN